MIVLPKAKIEKMTGDKNRPVLNGVCLDKPDDGFVGRLIATNGFGAAIVPIEVGSDDQDGIIPLEVIVQARKIAKMRGEPPCLFVQDGQVQIAGMIEKVDLVEGTFPTVDDLRPEFEGREESNVVAITFDAKHLFTLAQALLEVLPTRGCYPVRLTFDANKSNEPIIVEPFACPENADHWGLLMPFFDPQRDRAKRRV